MGFYTIIDDLYFFQLLNFVRKYNNTTLKLSKYFYNKTNGIFPEFIAVINNFIFFFVKKDRYFSSKIYLDSMRREITKKVLIIRTDNVFINLLVSFFPDLYIHDIKIEVDDTTGEREITLYFLNYRDRGIAIGRGGNYIKSLNELCQKYVVLENKITPLEIKCKFLG